MKKIISTIILSGLVIIGLTGCSTSNEEKNTNVNNNKVNEVKTVAYYKDDVSINLFINKYNNLFEPDITSDMITKKHIGGSDRDDVVTVSNDKLEVIIYGSNKYNELYSMSVYIGNVQKVNATNDDFKEQFIKYVKLLDESLTEEKINTYWYDMISEYRSSYEINEIDITLSVFDGDIEYFKVTSKLEL